MCAKALSVQCVWSFKRGSRCLQLPAVCDPRPGTLASGENAPCSLPCPSYMLTELLQLSKLPWVVLLWRTTPVMVRTESYVPKTNVFGLDVALFERYFGCKAVGPQEPGSGVQSPCCGRRISLSSARENMCCARCGRCCLRCFCMYAECVLWPGKRSDDAEITHPYSSEKVAPTEAASPGMKEPAQVPLGNTDNVVLVSDGVLSQQTSQQRHASDSCANPCV